MWWIPPITNELVVVAVHTTHIACIWIKRVGGTRFSVRAYRSYQCSRHEVGRGVLFNPMWVRTKIVSFLSGYKLRDAFIAFMPDSSSAPHGFVSCDSAHPGEQQFAVHRVRHTVYAHHYLYPDDCNRFTFYWYRIPHTLVVQYQLIAVGGALNCVRITPRFCALLSAYRAVHGAAFRPSQLAVDLPKNGNRISAWFTRDIINRFIQADDAIGKDRGALIDVVAACGIASLEKEVG